MNGLPAAELALLFQYAYTTVQQLESPACKTLPAEDILDSSLFILCVCVYVCLQWRSCTSCYSGKVLEIISPSWKAASIWLGQ